MVMGFGGALEANGSVLADIADDSGLLKFRKVQKAIDDAGFVEGLGFQEWVQFAKDSGPLIELKRPGCGKLLDASTKSELRQHVGDAISVLDNEIVVRPFESSKAVGGVWLAADLVRSALSRQK
jgi:hypothetical protein